MEIIMEIDYPITGTQAKKRVVQIDDTDTSISVASNDVVRQKKKTRTTAPRTEASSRLRQVANDRALTLANAFKSKNPFFVHVMKESDTVAGGWPNMYIPKTFREAYENWESNAKVILQVKNESWIVFCYSKCNQIRISRGWRPFASDNSLDVGDVCVFELISRCEKLFKVFIFRAAKETNCAENEKLPGVRSEADKARVLEAVKAFKPERPNFTVEVKDSYIYGGSMTVPKEFISKHITKDSCSVKLQLPEDGEVWPVKCYIKEHVAKFSAGWKAFVEGNKLAVGDICVFEVVKKKSLKVVIFRVKS